MKKFSIILITVIFLFAAIFVLNSVFGKKNNGYSTIKVSRANVVQEVSETGTIKMGEELDLGFKNTGKIEKIFVNVGDRVKTGDPLAKLETNQLDVQFTQAQAGVEVAGAQLNKLTAGASLEEIKIAETSVEIAQDSLLAAQKSLSDATTIAKENLKNAYEDALNVLEDVYLKAYNVSEAVKLIQRIYFTAADQPSITVSDNKNKIDECVQKIKSAIDSVKNDSSEASIDLALSETKKNLDLIYQAAIVIRQACEEPPYRDIVSAANKSLLDTQKSNINTALSNTANAQQTISSTRLTDDANINTAQAKVTAAQGSLKKAQEELSQLKAPPRSEDLDLYKAKLKQAQAEVNLLKTQLADSLLASPFDSQITDILQRAGESVQATVPVLSLLPTNPFYVETDIYEEDIVKVKEGNPTEIKLTSFPDQPLKGKVVSIEPAEKLIDQIVYYRVTINFDEPPQNLKPGMTADVVIKTTEKENVLAIPESAIEKIDNKNQVKVLINKKIETRLIELGLEGSNNLIEVISGLAEGEEIVVK